MINTKLKCNACDNYLIQSGPSVEYFLKLSSKYRPLTESQTSSPCLAGKDVEGYLFTKNYCNMECLKEDINKW